MNDEDVIITVVTMAFFKLDDTFEARQFQFEHETSRYYISNLNTGQADVTSPFSTYPVLYGGHVALSLSRCLYLRTRERTMSHLSV